jgi:hypothetical protein
LNTHFTSFWPPKLPMAKPLAFLLWIICMKGEPPFSCIKIFCLWLSTV